jgi:hypothetical protein
MQKVTKYWSKKWLFSKVKYVTYIIINIENTKASTAVHQPSRCRERSDFLPHMWTVVKCVEVHLHSECHLIWSFLSMLFTFMHVFAVCSPELDDVNTKYYWLIHEIIGKLTIPYPVVQRNLSSFLFLWLVRAHISIMDLRLFSHWWWRVLASGMLLHVVWYKFTLMVWRDILPSSSGSKRRQSKK